MSVTEHLGKQYTEENMYYYHAAPLIRGRAAYAEPKHTVVELFCGCGGTSLGFEKAGYEILLGVDLHRPSIETFAYNHPSSATILGDIRNVRVEDVQEAVCGSRIDVLIGGVPCQGFSLNNKKRNSDDRRNFLYMEYMRFVRAIQPKVLLIENVSGMRSTKNGAFVENIIADIEAAGNYKAACAMLNAADYGVPQKRQRLIFVGIRDDGRFDFDSVVKTHGPGTGRPYNTVRDAIFDLPRLKPGESAQSYDAPAVSAYQKQMRRKIGSVRRKDQDAMERGFACAEAAGTYVSIPEAWRGTLTCHIAPRHPQETVERIRRTKPGEPMYPRFKQRIRLAWDIQSPTQVSGGIRPQFQFGHPEDDRGLTIRERCRLQSFPDDFVVLGGVVQGRVQTGNAVPPLLAEAIAKAVRNYL